MDTKKRLARHIVSDFYDQDTALQAQQEFEAVFAKGGVPDDIELFETEGALPLQALLAKAGLAKSGSEAKRLIQQGAVSADGEKLTDIQHELDDREAPYLLKVGKRRFLNVRVKK